MPLIDLLIKEGWLKTDRIIEAFKKIKREDFLVLRSLGEGRLPTRIGYASPHDERKRVWRAEGVAGGPEDIKGSAELNTALPIGFGQTISQPLTVAFMLELLQPKEGDKILDVGSGSGWTTALLAYIVSQKGISKSKFQILKQFQNPKRKISNGEVIALEIVPELKELGEKNVSKYNFVKKGIAEFVLADGSKGYEESSPYDKILASASGVELPEPWEKQLKVGGRIVCPIGNSIWLFVKKSKDHFEKTEYPGFVFVPLISKQ